jgi:hypothetical protein
MNHFAEMRRRLPHLYRDGELVNDLLAQAALQLEFLDEEARMVQRAHWFDATFALEEAARLAALLDMAPEPWQSLGEFRAWVHAFRNARLQDGAVTVAAIRRFVREYSRAYQQAVGIDLIPTVDVWPTTPTVGLPFFDENPTQLRFQRVPQQGGLEPLQQFGIDQTGLDDTPVGFLLVGLAEAQEYVPLIVNVTRGEALVYRGPIKTGQRLWIFPESDGTVRGRLERQDVSDRLYSVTGVIPGQPWSGSEIVSPARAITLQRGQNQLWFFPLAHFDEEGLNRFLFSLPDQRMVQGRYDQAELNHALFYQPPAVVLYTVWRESEPAAFDVKLPAGKLLSSAGRLPDALVAAERLEFSLRSGVRQLAAAGVRNGVTFQPLQEVQPLGDFLTGVMPMVVREVGPTGADQLPDATGVFSVTEFEHSTFA